MNITFSRLIKYVFNRKYVIWFLLFHLYYMTHPILFDKNDLLLFHFDIELYQKQLFKILLLHTLSRATFPYMISILVILVSVFKLSFNIVINPVYELYHIK